MKKVLIVAMMLTIVTGYAEGIKDGTPAIRMTKFEFLDVKKGYQLTLKDSQGVILHKEVISGQGKYAKHFDLTALEDGYYTIELDKDVEILVKPFKIDANKVTFLTYRDSRVFKPMARLDNNQLYVSQLALDNEPLKVELYYNDEIIYKDELEGDKILERVYALSKEQKGDYYIRMTSGKRRFAEHFTL
ncbi:hypothetical protein [Psychroserpens algicola]|uniref:Secreted protein (Por secretion system target) n=1 Tax=Psychroserpens algicola TaxID=1719034 RepID=A0ABT0H3Z5_9FLAO|nr:hypothetical protein [Psychroserpens algicola]MCK8479100.1 hypothetical protein [Psychroserpens algicola]